MTNANKIEISVGSDGAKMALQGDVAANTGRGLAELFKPFIQWCGEKGDIIEHRRNVSRQIRVFNEEALRLALEKSINIADNKGIVIEPVSLKFLANWAEGVSLENSDEAENLIDLWSNLLANVSAENDDVSSSIFCSNTLKGMDSATATLFKNICAPISDAKFNKQDKILSNFTTVVIDRLSNSLYDYDLNSDHFLIDRLERGLTVSGARWKSVNRAAFEQVGKSRNYRVRDNLDYEGLSLQLSNLEALKLISHHKVFGVGNNQEYYSLEWFCVSPVGKMFYNKVSK